MSFSSIAKGYRNLTDLILNNFQLLADISLEFVAPACNKLARLRINGCRNMETVALEHIGQWCPRHSCSTVAVPRGRPQQMDHARVPHHIAGVWVWLAAHNQHEEDTRVPPSVCPDGWPHRVDHVRVPHHVAGVWVRWAGAPKTVYDWWCISPLCLF